MAKGRKFGSTHHERLLGAYPHGPPQGTSSDQSEFIEEDVWSIADSMDGHDDSIHAIKTGMAARFSIREDPVIRSRRWARATNEDGPMGGLSLAFQDGEKSAARIIHRGQDMTTLRHMASSAPVNVPVQPRFLRVESTESLQEEYETGYEDELEWIPPHEYLAREYAHSRKATSVFEGVGRTLKGRDMSRVRNAVWTQTGFDG